MLDYTLPKERIAQFPAEPRDSARLLVVGRKPGTVPLGDSPLSRAGGGITHRIFRDLPEFLRAGDCLVLNDTKVVPARLYGRKAGTGGKVELLLLLNAARSLSKDEIASSAKDRWRTRNDEIVYRCLGQPAKNLKPGTRLVFKTGTAQEWDIPCYGVSPFGLSPVSLQAEVLAWEEGERLVRFEGRGVEQALLRLGEMPLPPYIGRPVEQRDAEWYQTVFAREPGAVAAPTAGLHFTPELLRRIEQQGVRTAFVTLHVGWGTFKPVGEKDLAEGRLHAERYRIPEETLKAIEETRAQKGRVIAVGTTVVRTLETAYSVERRAYREGKAEGLLSAKRYPLNATEGTTGLFIQPGFRFRVVDGLITNFHLPGTSLLLLVSAFAGEERVQAAYQEAIQKDYRFYSYGDAMLIQ